MKNQLQKKGRLENKLREKLFCPPFMGRYETNLNTFKYKTVWPCKICMKLLLSETAAKNHAKSCKLTLTKEEDVPLAELAKMEKNMCYPCIYCIKKCRRKVNWLKHLNEHEKTRL
ncbi:uncharacterized protein LOC112597248 [Melanaphis sacchari]|uniref:uncharacterized protein LOC112597248 n=1 Tax=Melanaphis sacchari TaxID=742174 RepID=UPI000DC15641|nr:uncharacterized protein LOC112597248 [Melanaphis sacchari]